MNKLIPILLLLSGSASIQAADGNIEFTGKIIAAPCTLDPANSTVEVPLGTHAANMLAGKDTETTAVPFEIELTGCDNSTLTTVETRFTFTPDGTDDQLIAVTGGAANVAIKLMEENGAVIPPTGTSAPITLPENTDLILKFKANYISTAATVTPGDANASGTFELLYQ